MGINYDTTIDIPLYNHEKIEIESLHEKRSLMLRTIKNLQDIIPPDIVNEEIKTAINMLDEAQVKVDRELRNKVGEHYWRAFR